MSHNIRINIKTILEYKMHKWKNKILNWAEQDKDGQQQLEIWISDWKELIKSGSICIDVLKKGWVAEAAVEISEDYLPEEVIDYITEEEDYAIMGEIRSKAINYPVYYQELEEARIENFIAFKNSYEGKQLLNDSNNNEV